MYESAKRCLQISGYLDSKSKSCKDLDYRLFGQISPNAKSGLKIGADGELWKYLNGLIDEVRIYNRALTEAEIWALMPGYEPGEF